MKARIEVGIYDGEKVYEVWEENDDHDRYIVYASAIKDCAESYIRRRVEQGIYQKG